MTSQQLPTRLNHVNQIVYHNPFPRLHKAQLLFPPPGRKVQSRQGGCPMYAKSLGAAESLQALIAPHRKTIELLKVFRVCEGHAEDL